MSVKKAGKISAFIDDLAEATWAGTPPNHDTLAWLQVADRKLVDKLVDRGLCRPVRSENEKNPRIVDYVAEFIRLRTVDVKPGTLITYANAEKHLDEFFGVNRRIADVTRPDAKAYWNWLRTRKKLGENTAKKRFSTSRQFFSEALADGLLESNPFAGRSVTMTRAAKEFVEATTILSVLPYCPDDEWRLLFVFVRFAGPRVPSEIERLTWNDVDWAGNRILIKSPKTEGHGRAERYVPIFPELGRGWRDNSMPERENATSFRDSATTPTSAPRPVKSSSGFTAGSGPVSGPRLERRGKRS